MGILDGLSLFGYTLSKSDNEEKPLEAFELEKDTAAEIVGDASGRVTMSLDTAMVPATEIASIKLYREMSHSPDVDLALNEIRNEVFIYDVPGKKAIDISFDEESKGVSKAIQKKVHDEFDALYRIINFKTLGPALFDSFYIDGRLYLHKLIDKKKPKEGIQRIVKVDPTKIKRVREIPAKDSRGVFDINKIKEYYVYTDVPETKVDGSTTSYTSIAFTNSTGLKIDPATIAYVDSGLVLNNQVLGYLHKAIVPYNNLKLMEESLLIYRVARAPERRVIYVDIGNLPKNKAEQHVRDLMNRFRNKITYDSKTGGLVDKRNVLSMMEDYWLPRREGGKGTEITTLPGGENLGVITDVDYFKENLNTALNVPASRFKDQAPAFAFGKGVEIGRDEYRFKKFLDKLRGRFVVIFLDLLKTQLLLKNVITENDWAEIAEEIIWIFAEDNNFVEFKESEVLNNRINSMLQVDPLVGKYFTKPWVLKNVMRMTDKEIEELAKQVDEEVADNASKGLDAQGNPLPPEEPDEPPAPPASAGPAAPAAPSNAGPTDTPPGAQQNGPPFI